MAAAGKFKGNGDISTVVVERLPNDEIRIWDFFLEKHRSSNHISILYSSIIER